MFPPSSGKSNQHLSNASHLKKMPQKNGQSTARYQHSFSTRERGEAGVPGSCYTAISQTLIKPDKPSLLDSPHSSVGQQYFPYS